MSRWWERPVALTIVATAFIAGCAATPFYLAYRAARWVAG
jgi:hypothetical protein